MLVIKELLFDRSREAYNAQRITRCPADVELHTVASWLSQRYGAPFDEARSLDSEVGELVVGWVYQVPSDWPGFPMGHAGDTVAVAFGPAEWEGALVAPRQAIAWSYAADRADRVQPREVIVDREVARLYGARARAGALEPNREGKYKEARAALEKTARSIDAYAGGDAELEAIAQALRGEGAAYEHAMNAKDQKLRYFQSYNISMNRMPDGKARR